MHGWHRPVAAAIATYLDDGLGYGTRNPVKKWWFDLEIVDGVCVEAAANQRDLNLDRKFKRDNSTIGYYNADMRPAPDARQAVPLNHRSAVMAAARLETPADAARRLRRGGPRPAHYIPTVTVGPGESETG